MSSFNEIQKLTHKLNFFKFDLKAEEHLYAFEEIFKKNKGDWFAIKAELTGKEGFSEKVLRKLEFTHHLAEWSNNNSQVISVFQQDDNINSMRDIALNLNKTKLIEKVKAIAVVESVSDVEAFSLNLHRTLFHMEPTAMLVNIIKDPQVPILNDTIGANVAAVLEKRLDFNIKTTSVYEILKNGEALKNIPTESHEAVKTQLKTLQRIVAVSPVSDAVPILYNAKFHTALKISDMPSKQFMAMMSSKGLDESTIAQIHDNAQQTRVRNEQMLMAVREGSQPTGIALIDNSLSVIGRSQVKMTRADSTPAMGVMELAQEALIKHNLSWDLLFGDADFCECGECNSVYSAASYFVELLNYLRNNNLDPAAIGDVAVKANPKDISGTPLEKLFDRRPDLGCLELTCQNTNTRLPYIDLVNEVMESYVAFKYTKPFNVVDETSAELLAEPQHTEYQAYDILKDAVYPFNLPYHQPIDAIRYFLKQIDTSRHELFKTFKKNKTALDAEHTRLVNEALDRGIDAEFLGITKEEYVILTKEDFSSKALKEKEDGSLTDAQYQEFIGLQRVCKYYGFDDDASMLGDNGLKLIKKEFIRRTGINYFDLVDLLKTETINPCMPRGKSKVIMESLHVSYQYLQILAQTIGIDKLAQYLIDGENNADVLSSLKEQIKLLIDKEALSCPESIQDHLEITTRDIICWVKYHFEDLGKMIVIESGKKCINGNIRYRETNGLYGRIEDCNISVHYGDNFEFKGTIDKETGKVIPEEGDLTWRLIPFDFTGDKGETGKFYPIGNEIYFIILNQTDRCNIDTAQLKHMDGTALTVDEYDRIHRFIRLWRKLGWTINETDKAIVGLATSENQNKVSIKPSSKILTAADRDNSWVNILLRKLGLENNEAGDSDDCIDWRENTCAQVFDIDPHLIHQLVAIKKLLNKTGLELVKLLCFWTTISTTGEKSLYQRMFLTYNVLGIDKVFKADSSGNYLSGDEKLLDHIPAIMAALNLSADDIQAIKEDALLQDELTLANLSILYRYRLLSKVLGLRIPDFIRILPLFDDILWETNATLNSSILPDSGRVFHDPHATLKFMECWEKIEGAGFTYQQLNYIIRNLDDEKKPYTPTKKMVLQLSKVFYDNLNAIDQAHKDLQADQSLLETGTELQKVNIQEQATSELVRTKASLLFEADIVEKIIGLLEGTNVFTTNAPKDLDFILLDEQTLKRKLKYDKTGAVQITGVLTAAEVLDYKNINNDPDTDPNKEPPWAAALTRIQKQQNKLFKELLSGVFDNEKEKSDTEKDRIKAIIKAGDVLIPLDDIPDGDPDTNTAPQKRVAFLEIFLPYLRQQLIHRFIIDSLSNFIELDTKITDILVTKVLKLGVPERPIYDIFEKIKNSENNRSGRLTPVVDANYTFIIKNNSSHPFVSINGDVLGFTNHAIPADEWRSSTVALQAGVTYKLALRSIELENIFWETPVSGVTAIPSSLLAPDWSGYLIPYADASYTLIVKNSNASPIISIDGDVLDFAVQEDPNNEWWSSTLALQNGKLYKLATEGVELKDIFWKTPVSSVTSIPTSALIPDFVSDQCEPALIALKKAAMLVSTFDLSANEMRFLNQNSKYFDNLNLNRLTLSHWLRLEAYTRLRNSLPQTKLNLLDFWSWVYDIPSDEIGLKKKLADLSNKITELTNWKKESIDNLIADDHFSINKLENYENEKNLLKLQKALTVADKINIDINLLFEWAFPYSDFSYDRKIADSIKNAVRAKYDPTDWEQVVKPLNDQLRNNQKEALIAFLLQQKELIAWNVTDADGLFEYFLIDVQMEACMETSRIKQAISSVQLFIQRCFLGLEKEHNQIDPDILDRGRWEWMQRYRVWEANRKVFLYPENWIESNLRDDKSSFFKELESELLQKDINKQNVIDALKSYLYKLDEVANMEVVGFYIDGTRNSITQPWNKDSKLHVFSRTRSAPYFFYYRYLDLFEMNWYPWEKMQVDIPCYDLEDPVTHQVTRNGCYLTPVVWNGRLLVFFPQFMKKTRPNGPASNKSIKDLANDTPNNAKPIEYWEIKMAWSEYRNSKWTQKQVSMDAIYDDFGITINSSGASFEDVAIAVRSARDEAENANGKVGIAEQSSNKALDSAKRSNIAASGATDTIPGNFFLPFGVGFPLIVVTVNELHSQTFTAYTDAIVDASATAAAKLASDAAIEKANHAVTAVNNFEAANSTVPPNPYGEISRYRFEPVLADDKTFLAIRVFYNNKSIQEERGKFEFNGNSLHTDPVKKYSDDNPLPLNNFHYEDNTIYPLQTSDSIGYVFLRSTIDMIFLDKQNFTKFYHSYSQELIGKINTQSLEEFFKSNKDITLEDYGAFDQDNVASTPDIYHELKQPYSLYNWELFFHTTMLLGDAHCKAQQFQEAMRLFHFVFNPIAEGDEDNRFWQFKPFKEINSQRILDSIFNHLEPNKANPAINEWRTKPFMPHVVARSRPVAYMKWVVMKYIDNLLAWGDYLFRQDTIETLNQATQLYVLAGHILGPKPMMIPKRGKIKPQTYLDLLDKWDAFGNAMVELELAAPFSNQTSIPGGVVNGEFAYANIFGFSSSSYFCIPSNPKLLGYWDTIADRLYKIRHCENIEGIFRKLPLFEPPIDPALLVKAAAQGLSIASVLNDLNTPMPNYRFYYLLQKALELCNELKSLGGAMLSAIEKKDNETIALIRAKHESVIQNLVMEIKKKQLEEAQKNLDSLEQNRKGPEHRMKYYLQLIGEDTGKVPGLDSDFSELANSIEAPVDESGLKLISYEKEDMDKASAAADWQTGIGVVETLASILHVIPVASGDAKPFGIGAGVAIHGQMFGNAAQAVARGLQIGANRLTFDSTSAGKKGGFTRAIQDRIFQANAAGYELKQIDKQITTQKIRIDIANQEITNQQKAIDNSNEVEEFLKDKYTNEELYTWMRGSLKTLYHQVYNLAYDLAKKAEKTYCFERGVSSVNFIQAGYFDAGRDGLLAGEQLYVGLKQLEAAYQNERGYDYEITKHFSLKQLDPLALIKLRETGKCEFVIPEVLFDLDYPGHYKRRIKSVSLSIPCIAGPYTGVNATLKLMENKFRNTAISGKEYLEITEEADERFSTYIIPINAVAVSSAQNDGGVFELNFKDERYLPFEGAGAISKWRLELPTIRQYDYRTISDAIIHLKYTASEGGERLKLAAAKSLSEQLANIEQALNETGLHIALSLKHDLPNEWNLLKKNNSVKLTIDKSRLPYMAQALEATPTIEDVIFIAQVKGYPESYSVKIIQGITSTDIPLTKKSNEWKLCSGNTATAIQLDAEFELSVDQSVNNSNLADLEELMLVAKYKFV